MTVCDMWTAMLSDDFDERADAERGLADVERQILLDLYGDNDDDVDDS